MNEKIYEKTFYDKDNIVLNYENDYIGENTDEVGNLFKDKYLIGIKEDSFNETLASKDVDSINSVVNINDWKGFSFEFTKMISGSFSDKFNSFLKILGLIYKNNQDVINYKEYYDNYSKYLVNLSASMDGKEIDEIREEIANTLNKLEDLNYDIKETRELILKKYNELTITDDLFNSASNLYEDNEINIDKVNDYVKSLKSVNSNLVEFQITVKSLEESINEYNIRKIILGVIEYLSNELSHICSFLDTYVNQQSNNEDNIIYYFETSTQGLLNSITKLI